MPGAIMIVAGVAVLVDSFLRFALEGRGTPAPILPPNELVVSGLFRYVRNPMYAALLSVIVGQALVLGSATLVWYAAILWVQFHLFVLLYEERALRRRFGRSYEVYAANVRRWLPRVSPWRTHA
jgi:protein-S-isoprenylcysteine O-methyltransferase Ste14